MYGFRQLAQRTAAAFLRLFGEPVEATYKPRKGTPRPITIVVERNPPGGLPGSQFGKGRTATVYVLNDADAGITAAELDTGGDKLSFPWKLGGTPEDWNVNQMPDHDEGMLQLTVEG